jgi:Asp-tRNA(Asn)/Glu-tRNA(Gln) amidotransferase C subunit
MATVIEHMMDGSITARKRKTVDDLELAATWLEQYEGEPEDDREGMTSLATVAAWLRDEVARREAR